jgi:hypothetical protein
LTVILYTIYPTKSRYPSCWSEFTPKKKNSRAPAAARLFSFETAAEPENSGHKPFRYWTLRVAGIADRAAAAAWQERVDGRGRGSQSKRVMQTFWGEVQGQEAFNQPISFHPLYSDCLSSPHVLSSCYGDERHYLSTPAVPPARSHFLAPTT